MNAIEKFDNTVALGICCQIGVAVIWGLGVGEITYLSSGITFDAPIHPYYAGSAARSPIAVRMHVDVTITGPLERCCQVTVRDGDTIHQTWPCIPAHALSQLIESLGSR